MSKFAAVLGCAALIVGSMFVFTNTAEAHRPGIRIARGTARIAARSVRGASRVTYRAATPPIYRSPVRSYYSPYSRVSPYRGSVIRSGFYAPAPVYVSPRYYRPSYGFYFGF